MTFDERWVDARDLDYDLHGKGAAQEAWELQQARIDQLEADVKHWQGMADGYKVQLEEKRAENKALQAEKKRAVATVSQQIIHTNDLVFKNAGLSDENQALREREEKLYSSLMLATQVLEVIHSKYRLTDPTHTLLKEMRELLSESASDKVKG